MERRKERRTEGGRNGQDERKGQVRFEKIEMGVNKGMEYHSHIQF